jgi:hypothetical protein
MYDQTDCVFCLEEILSVKIETNRTKLFYGKLNNCDIDSLYTEIREFLNKSVILECNHIFHTGCFTKYIKHRPSTITCPICRTHIRTIDVIKIIHVFKEFFKKLRRYIKLRLMQVNIHKNITRFKLQFTEKYKQEYDEFLDFYGELYFLNEQIKSSNNELDGLFI